jgi:hypothetical protein
MVDYNTNNDIAKGTGNKCGHRPDSPRYFVPPEKHAQRPQILKRVIDAIRKYYAKPDTLPALNAVNESDRQQRSERREACVAILGCILHYTDLVTLRVGIPQTDGSMAGLTMPYLAELSGLGERRAERAIADLKAAGIITVHPICQKIEEAVYKGIAAIRTVSKELFAALGLGAWLRREREKAADRRRKKDAKRQAKQAANVQMVMNAQRGRRKSGEKSGSADEEVAGNSTRHGEMSPASSYIAKMREFLKSGADPPE